MFLLAVYVYRHRKIYCIILLCYNIQCKKILCYKFRAFFLFSRFVQDSLRATVLGQNKASVSLSLRFSKNFNL